MGWKEGLGKALGESELIFVGCLLIPAEVGQDGLLKS